MERVFREDILPKRERAERTLRHEAVDRVALHEQLTHNPGVIADWTEGLPPVRVGNSRARVEATGELRGAVTA